MGTIEIMFALVRLAEKKGKASFHTNSQIAKEAGLSPSNTYTSIKLLVQEGAVTQTNIVPFRPCYRASKLALSEYETLQKKAF
jgi:DNA-binding IclR family transcriptional regulator